ncbi:MAG: hypothetical protein JJU28_22555 [Cyclobacteriaceae bacterium]|nr:hypothetical protein [Cyclobacteriaceae bacterium]
MAVHVLAMSQTLPGDFDYWRARMNLSESAAVSKDMLSTRSVVIVNTLPGEDIFKKRVEWKPICETIHPYLAAIGVDPVLYYHMQDVFAAREVSLAIAQEMQKREIANIFFVDQSKKSGRDFYTICITTFNGKESFTDPGQAAWYIDGESLPGMMRPMLRHIETHAKKQENLLVLEKPEYYKPVGVVKGRRHETYMQDLRIENIAVPESLKGTLAIKSGREEKTADPASEVEIIFSKYPYKYGFTDFDFSEEEIRKKGFQYLLLYIHTTSGQARKFLQYRDEPNLKSIPSMQLQTDGSIKTTEVPADATIYKFYIKHIYTGDIYLGERWDAATTWQEALNNHLDFIIKALERKN